MNDNRRGIVGIDASRRFVEKEFVGDHVTMEVVEIIDHHGDKTNLPEELILMNYFSVRDNKIVSLIIVFNQPSPY